MSRGPALNVSLFITCYTDTLFPDSGKAVVRVLERLGHTVDFPAGQTCCGQMHINTGYQRDALPLLPRFVAQFRHAEAVVVPSSSCVTMMREHYPAMAATLDREGTTVGLADDVANLLPRVWEFSEFLTRKLGLTDVGACFPHRVTYHASCHGLRALALGDGPESLLRGVRGIDLVPLPGVEVCCGFGGTFAVKNADVSSAMLADKTAAILTTGAATVTACDNSCLMHIAGGLHRQRSPVRTLHLAEILAADETDESAEESSVEMERQPRRRTSTDETDFTYGGSRGLQAPEPGSNGRRGLTHGGGRGLQTPGTSSNDQRGLTHGGGMSLQTPGTSSNDQRGLTHGGGRGLQAPETGSNDQRGLTHGGGRGLQAPETGSNGQRSLTHGGGMSLQTPGTSSNDQGASLTEGAGAFRPLKQAPTVEGALAPEGRGP